MRDWLPDDHPACFVSELVDELDLGAIESYYEAETRGQPPYHPRLMVKLLVYGYCLGVRSSRKIARRVDEDIAFRVLAADWVCSVLEASADERPCVPRTRDAARLEPCATLRCNIL